MDFQFCQSIFSNVRIRLNRTELLFASSPTAYFIAIFFRIVATTNFIETMYFLTYICKATNRTLKYKHFFKQSNYVWYVTFFTIYVSQTPFNGQPFRINSIAAQSNMYELNMQKTIIIRFIFRNGLCEVSYLT